jgi:malonyl CoA-acyl carrier protein transacylase
MVRDIHPPDDPIMSDMDAVLCEVAQERVRQDAVWGEQNHPDGCFPEVAAVAEAHREHLRTFGPHWSLILLEEAHEAAAETDPARLREELLQVAAVAVAWVEAIDRRTAKGVHPPNTAGTPANGVFPKGDR